MTVYREETNPDGTTTLVEHPLKLANDNRLLPCFKPLPVEKLRVLVPAELERHFQLTDGFALCEPLNTRRRACWWVVRKFVTQIPLGSKLNNAAVINLDGEKTMFVTETGAKLEINR